VNVEVDVSELETLAKELAKAGDEKQREARAATQKIAQQVKDRAKGSVPRDSGETAKAIRRKTWVNKNEIHVDVYTHRNQRGFNVGFYLEYGTSRMPPRPFLAIQREWAAAALTEALSRIVDPFEENDQKDDGRDG
jgi:HK97 gp10 family phage protein